MKKKNLRKIGLKKSKISNLHTSMAYGGSSQYGKEGTGYFHTVHPCVSATDPNRPSLHCGTFTADSQTCVSEFWTVGWCEPPSEQN